MLTPADLPAAPTAPLPIGEFAAMIGMDWGDKEHAIALHPRGGAVETLTLKHSAESLHAWLESLEQRFGGQPVALAVEATKGAVVSAALEHPWLVIYPIHPNTSRRFSMAFSPSGAKNDQPDAHILLDLVRHHRDRLRALAPSEERTRRVALLSETRRKLVDDRAKLTNELTSLLKKYYPQALELAGETLSAPLALDFLDRWPELALLQKARPQTLRKFYYQHQVRRKDLVETRVALAQDARPLTTDRPLVEASTLQLEALITMLRALNAHVAKIEQALAEAFAQHPDAAIFGSLPGAGAAMAPRLCVLFGEERQRWPSAAELQKYYGIAPVIEKSGRQTYVHWRWNAPNFARQTLVEWAGLSVKGCAWAKAYYDQQKERGKSRSAILRSLAFKWLRVLWRCWQDRAPYDDAKYLAQLRQREAPYLKFLPTT